ncbi:MAG: hypothetical protein CVU89_00320 [Firmicutes bacterium HGW-Firmicutes-14]|nr:MAG: hypothetical protein CVU89_00320 [Firmicutes bacterium HGW-Firmicutes-14]
MTNIDKQHLIKRENLNRAQYFRSVLQEARRLNLLTDSEFNNIKMQTMQLLARQAERYTGGDSSSIKEETAQGIMQSVFYSIDVCLKSFPDADMSIGELKHKPLAELYRQGKKLVEAQLEYTKQMYNEIRNNCIATDNCAYNDTIQSAIPAFFSAYDVEFAAHDTPASIDYPLSNDKMELTGIEYIHDYLQKLLLENRFCKNFSNHDINSLLRGYDVHYQDLLINIFGLVLTNTIGCILAEKSVLKLDIQPFDKQYLQQKLVNMTKEQLDTILQDASEQLFKEFKISDRLLQNHITATALDFSPRIKNALGNNRLESVFISLKEKHPQGVVEFEDGRKMDDELFRRIADEVRQCRYTSDKIAIIKREIHSMTDLVDILEGSCLLGDEFSEVFQYLGDMELAWLLTKLPADTADADLHYTENEKDWHARLDNFLKEMNLSRRESIFLHYKNFLC